MRLPIPIPIPADDAENPAAARSRSENSTTQRLDQHARCMDTSRHGSVTESPLEHASGSGPADAVQSRCSSVDDEGSMVLTPASSACSMASVMEASCIGFNSEAGEEAVDDVDSNGSRGDGFSAVCSSAEARSLETSHQGGGEVASDNGALRGVGRRSGGSRDLGIQCDYERANGSGRASAQATQNPRGTYEQVGRRNEGSVTIKQSDGTNRSIFRAARSNNNAPLFSNWFSFANPFASPPSNPANTNTSSRSYNIFSSDSATRHTSTSSHNTFTNQTLSGCYFSSGTTITNCRLTACQGQGLTITNCSFKFCNFSDSIVTNCTISGSNLASDNLINCTLSDCNMFGGSRMSCTWSRSNVYGGEGLKRERGS